MCFIETPYACCGSVDKLVDKRVLFYRIPENGTILNFVFSQNTKNISYRLYKVSVAVSFVRLIFGFCLEKNISLRSL
jgi:hypothetical protein